MVQLPEARPRTVRPTERSPRAQNPDAKSRGNRNSAGKRGGAFHGEIDRCRESQGWTTACSSMPEHDGKDQGEDSTMKPCSCGSARHS